MYSGTFQFCFVFASSSLIVWPWGCSSIFLLSLSDTQCWCLRRSALQFVPWFQSLSKLPNYILESCPLTSDSQFDSFTIGFLMFLSTDPCDSKFDLFFSVVVNFWGDLNFLCMSGWIPGFQQLHCESTVLSTVTCSRRISHKEVLLTSGVIPQSWDRYHHCNESQISRVWRAFVLVAGLPAVLSCNLLAHVDDGDDAWTLWQV
jgi:hypothetical protein